MRLATPADAERIADALARLLAELGGTPPDRPAMLATTRELVGDRQAGAVIVAATRTALLGVLAASWQSAIHVPGRYALIQDLWVDPSHRSRQIGAALLDALVELARQAQVGRIEVGLPRDSFPGLRATSEFYERNRFQPLGPRMRLLLT